MNYGKFYFCNLIRVVKITADLKRKLKKYCHRYQISVAKIIEVVDILNRKLTQYIIT